MATVGIVGIGAMGSAMASRLIEAGFAVVGTDPRPAAREELTGLGGKAVTTARAVAEAADYVLLSLPSVKAFHAVIEGADGIAASAKRGLIVADTSTLPIADKDRGHAALAKAGMTLLDCTVSGNRDMILARTLTAYVAGDEQAYHRVAPAFDTFNRKHTYVGAFGMASKVKFVINYLVCILTAANGEAMALAIKAGIDPAVMYDLVKDSAANSRLWEIRAKMAVTEDYTSSRGNFLMADKDGPIIGDFARELSFPAVLFQAALQMHQVGVSLGMYNIDTAAMCRVYEIIGGVERKGAGEMNDGM